MQNLVMLSLVPAQLYTRYTGTNSFSLRDWINEHVGGLPPRLHVGKFILQLLHSSPLRLDKRTCLEITNFCVSDVGSTKPTSFSETLGAGGAPCCTASSPPSPIHSGATMSSILLVSWQRLVRSCPSLIRPLCTNASTIRTSQNMRRIFVACQNPRLSAVSPALNHAGSSSSEAIHESCNASFYTAPWTFRTSCSALTHSQCVLSVCVLCCVLCFDVFWCCLVCFDVLCCVVLGRVVSCRGVACVCVCVCVCACVNVSKSFWCVVSCHVVINGPREQQSANSAIRRNSYDPPDPTLRHSRVPKFTRDSLSCVSLFVL